MKSDRILLVHWKDGPELDERRARLEEHGYAVEVMFREGGAPYRRMKNDPPAVVVIDLSRMPSHGRHLGLAIRERKSTQSLPIVFVDGLPEKVARVRAEVPNALFCSEWKGIASSIERAKKTPIPIETFRKRGARSDTGYSGTALPKKLGVRENSKLALLAAPQHIRELLGELPTGCEVRTSARGKSDILVLFCLDSKVLEKRLGPATRAMAEGASLWIAWPKKSSSIAGDLSGDVVRERGLATGLVDTKVCAIDADWSGLRFMRRRRER